MPLPGKLILYGFFISLGLCFTTVASGINLSIQNPIDTVESHIKNSLVSYCKKYPQEKVFVHTNQPAYYNGETIWYKVYTMAYGKPSGLSKIIYVQLSDTAGNIIIQNKLPLIDGKAHGNIDISQKIKSGWYKLCAFTSWMMNFAPESYYNQRIYIRNPETPVSSAEKLAVKESYHISFYPEGGDLVDGNISKIAFRAYSDDGVAVQVTGVVKDNTGKTITSLATVHDGMGMFTIETYARNSYTASVLFPDGSRQEIILPKVKETGISLQASQNAGTVEVKLAFSSPREKVTNCVLAASQNNGQVATYPLQLGRGINTFELNKAVFSTGILRLTVFGQDGTPQAERIVFVNKYDIQTLLFKADTLSITAKAGNSFSVQLKDNAGFPVKGNFSVVVTDNDAFGQDEIGQNIFSALLLSPELKGEIHDPGYYFKNESDSLAEQLDLVMLTNGWRHFAVNALVHPVEQSQYIAGKVVNYKNQEGFKIKLLTMSPDSTKFVGYITPDSSGRFIVKNFNHTGLSDVYLETADKKNHIKKLDVKLFITLDDSLKRANAAPFIDQAIPDFPGYYLSAEQNESKNRQRLNGVLLNEVKINSVKINPTDELIKAHVTSKYETNRMFTLDLVNNPTLNIGLVEYMKGRFPGLMIYGDVPDVKFVYRGLNTLHSEDASGPPKPNASFLAEMGTDGNTLLPYFYVNEAPVSFQAVMRMSLSEIAIIRFIPPPVYFAPYDGGNTGAIMIYTKIQSDGPRKINSMEGFDHFIFHGYSITREFSVPDYKTLGANAVTDNRTTLYWNHDLNTDSNGILRFRFNNSDKAKEFKVILQGMDNDGKLVYLEKNVQ